MRTKRISATCVGLFISFLGAANAKELDCSLTQYADASRHNGFELLVPPRAVHTIDGNRASMTGTGLTGDVEERSDRIKLIYFGELDGVGETEVIYTYFKSNGTVTVKTRGLRAVVWDQEFPERAGKYIVKGTCRLK